VIATPIGDHPPSPVPYTFSHTPPVALHSSIRWPGTLQHQGPPSYLSLHAIIAWIVPFLAQSSLAKLAVLNHDFSFGANGYPYYLYRPWSPLRRRRWGFGTPSKHRSSVSDRPHVHQVLHHSWTYMTPADRIVILQTYPIMTDYLHLRQFAVNQSLSSHIAGCLQVSQLVSIHPSPLNMEQLSCA
jgi:hypothetical protein